MVLVPGKAISFKLTVFEQCVAALTRFCSSAEGSAGILLLPHCLRQHQEAMKINPSANHKVRLTAATSPQGELHQTGASEHGKHVQQGRWRGLQDRTCFQR